MDVVQGKRAEIIIVSLVVVSVVDINNLVVVTAAQ